MINRFKRIICLLACLCMCFCFFACGGEASLSISGKKRISMEAGTTHVLSVQGLQTVEEYEWSSSDPSVATVDNAGRITAVKAGEAIITISAEGTSASVTVSVRDSRRYSVTIGDELVTVKHGETLSKPADPQKQPDAQYTYTFKGWYVGGKEYDFSTPVTSHLVIEAVYDTVVNKYDVVIGDAPAVQYEYGSLIESPANPQKPSTAEYDYVFRGWYYGERPWNFASDTVKGDVTLVPKYVEVPRTYCVTFDGAAAQYLKYGEKIEKPADPVMAADARYTYEFVGWYDGNEQWDFAADVVTKDTDLVAVYDEILNEYDVLVGENSYKLAYGAKISQPADPVKAPDAMYTYTFAGWITKAGESWDFDNDVVTGDTVLVADYEMTLNKYTVVIDGVSAEYYYGERVTRPATPVKQPDEQNTYYFDKYVVEQTGEEWNFATDIVTGDTTLVAQFKTRTNKYLVSFGGIRFEEYDYGEKIVRPDDPVREADDRNEYYFDHWEWDDNGIRKEWDFDVDTVGENKPGTLYPVFTAQARSYVVSFMNGGAEFATSSRTRVGEKIEEPQAQPEKQSTASTVYTFIGWYNGNEAWDFENDVLEGPLTLTAKYSAATRNYSVVFEAAGQQQTYQYTYGSTIARPADPAPYTDENYRYEFVAWVNEKGEQWNFASSTVTEDIVLTAKFNPSVIYYEATYVNEYGQLIYTFKVSKGNTVPEIAGYGKQANVRYSYNFLFWSEDGETAYDFTQPITADMQLVPVFEEVLRTYTVTLKNWDDTVFKTMDFTYGEAFEYAVTEELPIKVVEGDENSYVFEYWSDAADGAEYTGTVTSDITLYAVYRIDNNEYTITYYDWNGNVIEDATETGIKYNRFLNLPDVTRPDTMYTSYTFMGWATEQGGEVVYPAGAAVRCNGDMNMYPVYEENVKYYYVSLALTDEDGTYVITDEEGNALTEDDLVFTYNQEFRFKVAVNSESKGSVVVKRFSTTLTPDENGVYSLNVREELVRLSVTGLTLRRYTITDEVEIAKQNEQQWAKFVNDESDIIVKLTRDGEVSYVEDAVKEGVMTVSGIVAGNYTVEYVALDNDGNYRSISEVVYTNTLNAAWAIENGQDETMTWTLGGTFAGYTPVTIEGNYKWIDGVITMEEFADNANATIRINGFNPGTGDFIATASYSQPSRGAKAEGPSTGIKYFTADGTSIEINFLNEGVIRIISSATGWDNRKETGKLVCGTGAILNIYDDCYTLVTVTHVKENGYLYLFGSFSKPGSDIVAITDRLLAVIDTTTGTLYTNSEIEGSSRAAVENPLRETGVFKALQDDELKKLADIEGAAVYFGITNASPIEIYGINYSLSATDIKAYTDTAKKYVEADTDDHINIRVNNATGSVDTFLAWQDGALRFVPDSGYVIDTVTINGETYAASVDGDGHFVLPFYGDFAGGTTTAVQVTSTPGNYNGQTTVSGQITSDGKAMSYAALKFELGGKTHIAYADKNGNYEIMLPAGEYIVTVQPNEAKLEGYAYADIYTVYPYKGVVAVSGAAMAGDIELDVITGGYNIDAYTHMYEGSYAVTGDSDAEFKADLCAPREMSYMLNRKLADGQMISYTVKFGERQGDDIDGDADDVVYQDMYIKNFVDGKELGLGSYGGTWGGGIANINPTPFSSIVKALSRGIYNTYEFGYARSGNTVYLLVRYYGSEDWVAVASQQVTSASAPVKLFISGRPGYWFDYEYAHFAFIDDKTQVEDIIADAKADKTTAKTKNIGNPDENGKYAVHIDGDYGAVIADKIYDKTQGAAVIEATVDATMQGYAFIGFVMRDPATGNMVNIGINERSGAWRTSVGTGNGWSYRSANNVLGNVDDRVPAFEIGVGNNAAKDSNFTLKAVVQGDTWTIYVNGYLAGTVDLREYYENNYLGGGGTSATPSGNAKHGWDETSKLFPTGDKVQLGVYAFADKVKDALFTDITLRFTPETYFAGFYMDGIEQAESSEDIVYTAYIEYGNTYNTVLAHSPKGIADGEAFVFTMSYNDAEGSRKAHGTNMGSDRQNGDMYINLGADGTAYRISSTGCTTTDTFNNRPKATAKNNVWDFAMDRDTWGGVLLNVAKYDFAFVKADGKLDLYGKYHGATEWALVYTAANTKQVSYIDYLQVTSAGNFIINFSLSGVKVVPADDVLSHTWNYASGATAYASASKTIAEDGATGYTVHLGVPGQNNNRARWMTSEYYNAADSTVVVEGDYSWYGADHNWALTGWNFVTTDSKAMFIGMRSDGGNRKFFIGFSTGNQITAYNFRYAGITAANPDAGLLVCDPGAMPEFRKTLSQFSAKWVVSGYRYMLYIGEYGEEATQLILDIDIQKYASVVKLDKDGNSDEDLNNKLWGGSHASSVDKVAPDMSSFRMGFALFNDNVGTGLASKCLIFAENVFIRQIYTGEDTSLTGPDYVFFTDGEGNRVVSDTWYAEAVFSGSVNESSWAGIITDIVPGTGMDNGSAGTKNDFYGTGYGYGQVYIHKPGNDWSNGSSGGNTATGDTVKIGSARVGNKVYVFIDDVLRGSYYVGEQAGPIGLYAGTGSGTNQVTVTDIYYTLDADEVMKKVNGTAYTVTSEIEGKSFTLNKALMDGFFEVNGGGVFRSFGQNYTVTGPDSADMTDITFSYAAAQTGNIYYMEAEFSNKTGWVGILCNTFDTPAASNNYFYGVGFGYGNATSTQLYLSTNDPWGGNGMHLGSFPIDGGETVRMGIARINEVYYVFLDGKFATMFSREAFSTQDTSVALPYDNESGFGIFNGSGPNKTGSFTNARYTTDEDVVRAIVDTVKLGVFELPYTEQFVVSGKMDISNPGSGNRYIGFDLNGGADRFLLWDSDANGTFEYAYSKQNSHVHMGNLPASQYLTVGSGVTTIDWKVLHDGKNAYFFIDGDLKLVYTNAVKGSKFNVEIANVTAKVYDLEVARAGNPLYEQELESNANIIAKTQTSARAMIRMTYDDGLEISHGAISGTTRYQNINPLVHGTFDNYIYETTLVIAECGNNAHFGVEFSDDNVRFLIWRTGDPQDKLKITWAYDGGWASNEKYQIPLTGTYKIKAAVVNGDAYLFVNDTLMCAIKVTGQLSLRFENMMGHTENSTVLSKYDDTEAFNAAIAALNLPAISGPTRF